MVVPPQAAFRDAIASIDEALARGRSPVYAIPFQDRLLVYAPLARVAFVANAAMARLTAQAVTADAGCEHGDARAFIDSTGLLEPAAPPPTVDEAFAPSVVVLLLTRSCNFRCTYCYASAGGHSGAPMSPALARAAIDLATRNAQARGRDHISLSFHGGGEPVLAWDSLTEAVAHARRQPVVARISLATNGGLDAQQLDWVIANIDEVSLSCDGAPSVQDRQRPLAGGGASSDRVFATIAALDRHARPYGIRLTVTESSVDELPANIDYLCCHSNCRTFQAEPAFPHGRALHAAQSLTAHERFVQAFLTAHDVANSAGRNLTYSGARPLSLTNVFCTAPHDALIVDGEGRLTACYEVFAPELELGPSFFHGRLLPDGKIEIDQGRRQGLLARIAERRRLCRDCFCYFHCAGDCPAKTFDPSLGGHLHFGFRCHTNRAITLELLGRLACAAGGVWRGEVPDVSGPPC